MIEILLKMWDNGSSEKSNKLLLRFGSIEERNLTSMLGEIFNLSVVKGVSLSDLKSLNYAKWSITEFCKQIAKYPLWSLLYCDKIKEKKACIETIKDLISLLNQDSYSLDKIKSLYHKIKGAGQVDLYKLCTNPKNYQVGFENYINGIKDVELQQEWWDELEEEIGHLQSEIAFRREEDVRSTVMSFYINKIKKAEPAPISRGMVGESIAVPVPVPIPVQVKPDDIKKARSLVRVQTMPNMLWQKVVLDLIDEHPEVSQFLITYLGS